MSSETSEKVKARINHYLDEGLRDKQKIYSLVVNDTGVPRPTVRRIARDLRNEMLDKIRILQSEIPKPGEWPHPS